MNSPTRIEDSIVRIDVNTPSGEEFKGTGVILSRHGLIVTAYHVICDDANKHWLADPQEILIRKCRTEFNVEKIESVEREPDCALLRMEFFGEPLVDFIPLRKTPLKIGEAISIVGYTEDLYCSANHGHIEGFCDDLIIVSATAQNGMSGGPMLDSEGSLVGIITHSDNDDHMKSRGFRAAYIQRILDGSCYSAEEADFFYL